MRPVNWYFTKHRLLFLTSVVSNYDVGRNLFEVIFFQNYFHYFSFWVCVYLFFSNDIWNILIISNLISKDGYYLFENNCRISKSQGNFDRLNFTLQLNLLVVIMVVTDVGFLRWVTSLRNLTLMQFMVTESSKCKLFTEPLSVSV